MHLSTFLLCLTVGALVECAAGSDWCYTGCEHTPVHWKDLPGSFCGKERQSPIDINTAHVEKDERLTAFTLTNFSSRDVIKSMTNNGHSVKCILEDNKVEVSGGGLEGTYSTIQFHFHWGATEHHPGSEHTFNGHRYPMEMHIVSLEKGLDATQAVAKSEGIAVLGFFLNGTDDGDMTGPWSKLVAPMADGTDLFTGTVDVAEAMSIADLIAGVDLTKFYRYLGSLTTPSCNEAVAWTVFHQPINVNKKLLEMFPTKTGLTNVFRPTQNMNGRKVTASPATPLPPGHPWCYDKHCAHDPSKWSLLPDSHCGGKSQSPVNIETAKVEVDQSLVAFNFTNFDHKRAIDYITNTGHSVKCVLKEGLVEVSGGGLGHVYSTLQFHFHWGTKSKPSGSEHMVDDHRYPMEMHIVNKRKDLILNDAVNADDGLAVLGFFIEAPHSTKNSGGGGSDHHEAKPTSKPTANMAAWKKLTSYLSHMHNIGSKAEVTEEISIDDLLGDVSRTSYFRYNGSLTTPSCNEAVVWTVFKQSVKMDSDMMEMFPTRAGLADVFRPAQQLNARKIRTSSAAQSTSGSAMFLLLTCVCALYL